MIEIACLDFLYAESNNYDDKISTSHTDTCKNIDTLEYDVDLIISALNSFRKEISSPLDREYIDALALINCALESKPGNAKLIYERARTHQKVGQFQRAVTDYDVVLSMDNPLPRWWVSRGLALAGLGEKEEAIRSFDQAIKLGPGDPSGYYARGSLLASMGDLLAALSDLDKAIDVAEVASERVEIKETRGIVRAALGDYEGGIEDYTSILSVVPGHAPTLEKRGSAYAAIGRNKEAIADYERALEIDPDNEDIRESLEEVRSRLDP
ncbi:tetratricopeptide repeat protein [Bauldia sp.]|uniref:tetratricopeptide repeat protein n=1 Tax=Bauldia sp. TaxID=2575872 RepID=UPI003BAA3375